MRPDGEGSLRCDLCGVREEDDLPRPDDRRVRCEGLGDGRCPERWETFVTCGRWPRGRHLGPRCYARHVTAEEAGRG